MHTYACIRTCGIRIHRTAVNASFNFWRSDGGDSVPIDALKKKSLLAAAPAKSGQLHEISEAKQCLANTTHTNTHIQHIPAIFFAVYSATMRIRSISTTGSSTRPLAPTT